MSVDLRPGDCLEVLAGMAPESIDACVTDPPYHLLSTVERFAKSGGADRKHDGDNQYGRLSRGFMGKVWDGGDIAFRPETWAAVLRVLKPGAHLVAFGAPKNYHRLACAIEDAGFEIRDSLMWLFGSGFPKSHDVAKGIDKTLGATGTYGEPKSAAHAEWIARGRMRGDDGHDGYQRPWMDDPDAVARNARQYVPGSPEAEEWQGWGTALKPAYEPIILARKPLIGTVAANVLAHGTGAINIDATRIHADDAKGYAYTAKRTAPGATQDATGERHLADVIFEGHTKDGRWPANIVHDGSDEVLAGFPKTRNGGQNRTAPDRAGIFGPRAAGVGVSTFAGDTGSAARFFYCAKAGKADRAGSKHPTVKPLALMRWLCRLVTPPGGVILDPFAGSGTTGQAAQEEGFSAILIEREAEYQADIRRRLAAEPDDTERMLDRKDARQHELFP